MPDQQMDVPAFLRTLPVGAVFTHAAPDQQADSWVKIGEDTYRRTYDWVRFQADDFASWDHAELTEPVSYSITQDEADAKEARVRAMWELLRDGDTQAVVQAAGRAAWAWRQ